MTKFLFLFIALKEFILVAESLVNPGSLIIKSGEFLEINTTAPSINCSSFANYNSTLQERSSPQGSHLVAHIEFIGNIEFRSGSTVQVFGKYALSLRSQNGNISMHTDVNMTCGEKIFDTTCLGGFTQNSTEEEVGDDQKTKLYQGLGPGGLKITKTKIHLSGICTPGASHGGNGGRTMQSNYFFSLPKPYDINNRASLLGGSGGSCVENPGSVSGGGAMELVAEKGAIIIGASIIAEAQSDTTGACTGGSGGLIRLNASKVIIHQNGKLIVDGGSGQDLNGDSGYYFLAGGAGGVIQIIAPEGEIAAGTLSLKHGVSNHDVVCNEPAENGYFLLEANETAGAYNDTKLYKWPPRPNYNRTIASSNKTTGFCVSIADVVQELRT